MPKAWFTIGFCFVSSMSMFIPLVLVGGHHLEAEFLFRLLSIHYITHISMANFIQCK